MSKVPSADESGRNERVFVLRFWHEPGAAAPSAQRGSIVEVESGRRFYFTQLGDLKDFLALRLAAEDRGDPSSRS